VHLRKHPIVDLSARMSLRVLLVVAIEGAACRARLARERTLIRSRSTYSGRSKPAVVACEAFALGHYI